MVDSRALCLASFPHSRSLYLSCSLSHSRFCFISLAPAEINEESLIPSPPGTRMEMGVNFPNEGGDGECPLPQPHGNPTNTW